MTLKKAIEILTLAIPDPDSVAALDMIDAIELGLAALKTISFYRSGGSWDFNALLEYEQPEKRKE